MSRVIRIGIGVDFAPEFFEVEILGLREWSRAYEQRVVVGVANVIGARQKVFVA